MSRRRQSNNFNFHQRMLAFNRKAKKIRKVKENIKKTNKGEFKGIDLTESKLKIDHPVKIEDIHELSKYSLQQIQAVNNSLKNMLGYEYFHNKYLKHLYDLTEIVKLFELFYDEDIIKYKSWDTKSKYRKKKITKYMLNKYNINDIKELSNIKNNLALEDKIPFAKSVYKLTGQDIAMSLLNIPEAKNINEEYLKDFKNNQVEIHKDSLTKELNKHKMFTLNGNNIQFLINEYLISNLDQIQSELILQTLKVNSKNDLKQTVSNMNELEIANSINNYVIFNFDYIHKLDNIVRSLKNIFSNLDNNFDKLEDFVNIFINHLTAKNGNNIFDVVRNIIKYLIINDIDNYNDILIFFENEEYKEI